ncbi:MAG: DUF3298 domain-containing protein [Clostridia bacterium]|nr:DUF3298 domain-containing protein [Clostridia bacterium]
MEENNTQLNNSKKENGKPKKKGGKAKIILVIIIVIMAIVIGVLSWLLISGKNVSTILDDIKESLNLSSEKNEEDKNENDKKNSEDVDNEDKDKEENNKEDTGNVSGKGGDNENVSNNTNLKDSFKVKYDTRGVRNITIGGASFVCNEDVPEISGISQAAANKMEKYLNDWYSKVWKDINAQTEDDYIKELLNQMSENSNEYGPEDIGFHQSYKVIYLTNKLVTFQHILEGGLGGVSWGSTSGVSFDLETGDIIENKNIVTSKEKYIEACKKYVFDELKKDSRYNEVLEMHGNEYEGIINSAIEKLDGYFTEDGIVCVEIPKYSIASGASGEFKFTVPYSLVKDYINNKYIENTSDSSSNNTSKKEFYTPTELEKMALDYYEAKTGYRPSQVASDVNQDGTVSIQLYDNMGDHNTTSDWYTVDAKTAVGENIMKEKIDLKVKPARDN